MGATHCSWIRTAGRSGTAYSASGARDVHNEGLAVEGAACHGSPSGFASQARGSNHPRSGPRPASRAQPPSMPDVRRLGREDAALGLRHDRALPVCRPQELARTPRQTMRRAGSTWLQDCQLPAPPRFDTQGPSHSHLKPVLLSLTPSQTRRGAASAHGSTEGHTPPTTVSLQLTRYNNPYIQPCTRP